MPRQAISRLVTFLAAPLFLVSAVGTINTLANETKLDVHRISAKLLKESRDEEPNVTEQDKWPHFDDCFEKVTKLENGHRVPIDWTAEEGFIALEFKEKPDHTQRATFMRRVGEVIERWAKRQDRSDYYKSYTLAALQWSMVLEYCQWEEGAAAEGGKSTVRLDLRKLRDLASYNEVFCKAEASKSDGAPPPKIDQLSEFAKLTVENVGPKVLKEWRKLLSSGPHRNATAAVKANDNQAKARWQALLNASESYLAEVEKFPGNLTPLNDVELRQIRSDRSSLPKPTN